MTIDLSALGCPLNKIVLNPYGPDPDFFGVKPTFTQKHFTVIGRFVAKKAPHLAITAFSKIAKQHPDAKLFLGGTGTLLNGCVEQVKRLGNEKQVCI